ncbi:MAG: hypothetical protein U0903_16765 [Planctomycetales bacterium]
MSPYQIRLLGPWDYKLVSKPEDSAGREASGTIIPPAPLPIEADVSAGVISLLRRFHPPTNLTEADRLMLLFPGCVPNLEVALNGIPLTGMVDATGAWRVPIPFPLRTNNELELAWSLSGAESELAFNFQGAILEIHSTNG